ncbi:MAG: molybdopterin molybdotransferase MoeA [Spirochaetales bacterium]|nr:molybdopterin molybdotransferase MoeA [Spirochaetales bacterium]
MIQLHDAEVTIKNIPVFPRTETIPLMKGLGRILAEEIVSPLFMPPFHKSAMDGYAIIGTDTSEEYVIKEVIQAGSIPGEKIEKGECAKIMTGAMLPEGADRVVKVEVTEEKAGIMKITAPDPNINICYKGEDIKPGDPVLAAGTRIRPQEIAAAASMGKVKIITYKQPTVGIIATGSELVMPGNPLGPGQIYNSNSFSLAAQVKATGAKVMHHGIVIDTEEAIQEAITSLEQSCDMILLSGGVSMGDYDFVPGVLKKLNVSIHFEKIAVKPGKPTVFGTKERTFYFGVPGNPVSTFVIFTLLIKPLIYRMMGHDYIPLIIKGVLHEPIIRKRANRSSFIPVIYENGKINPIAYHGSAHIHALTKANGLINIPRDVFEIPAETEVDVRSI